MADPLCRVRVSEGGFAVSQPLAVATGRMSDAIPCKEWSIPDDCLNLCDTASFTVANVDGENAGKFKPGMRVEMECSDDDVRQGEWVRAFTGVISETQTGTDASGGSVILVTCPDVGWFLTSCHARPLLNIKNKRFDKLLDALIDPSWGIKEVRSDNDLSRRIKHGRQVVIQNFKPVLGAVLPYIQVEPGQAPADIIVLYAAREGLLVNAAADGALVFFRPNYSQQALFTAVVRPGEDSGKYGVTGRPSLRESLDGMYSSVECWSTVVIDPALNGPKDAENPNAAFRHTTFTPSESPTPFARRHVFTDPEAINDRLRKNRATWKWQMGLFQSWTYEVDFDRHSQDGAFFCSDTMITVDDEVCGVKGTYYVQSVRRSQTVKEGTKCHLVVRKPGLLNPDLQTLDIGGGAKHAAGVDARGKVKLSAKLKKLLGL